MALVKAARMYGAGHKRADAQMNTCWAKLQTAIGDNPAINLGASNSVLSLEGLPVGDSPVEKGLADMLTRGGVNDIRIVSHVTFEEFTRFVKAIAEGGIHAGMIMLKLREELGDSPSAGIQFGDTAKAAQGGGGGSRSRSVHFQK